VEHSGLGRMGVSLNPWGDLIAHWGKSLCITKPGGKALVGVPTGERCGIFNSNIYRIIPNKNNIMKDRRHETMDVT